MAKRDRLIRLEAAGSVGAVRFISALGEVTLAEDKKTSWVTVTRTGDFNDPRYGQFSITRALLDQMVKNFAERTYGQDIFIDVAHKPENGAAAKVLRLAVEGDRLRAQVEWTQLGVEAVKVKGFSYLSAEYHENWRDNEKGEPHGCVLLGAGLVTRPCIKRLDPVQLSESEGGETEIRYALHPKLLSDLISDARMTMNKFLEQLKRDLEAKGLNAAVVKSLCEAATKAMAGMTDEGQMKALCEAFMDSAKALAEGQAPGNVSVSVGLTAEQVQAQVTKALADQVTAAKTLAEAGATKVKLLADTIAATIKDEALAKSLTEAVAGVVGGLDDSQIKQLAAVQITAGEQQLASKKLKEMGFAFTGSAHVSVDSSNEVKALQEQADIRLGFAGRPDAERFRATGGVLQPQNKAIAEKVLAEFDRTNGHRLHAEHRMLAAGDSLVSDVAVPATFERTVIREALYQQVGLQFVDVGTAVFAGSHDIPYSYRDTGAAGVSGVRVYEGGAIARSAMKQAIETAYPIPQKLAFEVSDELRYLTSNGQLVNWDAVAENARNATRIVSEDGERLIFNEVLNASDQYAVTAVVDEATATADGTKSIFVLNSFPVVRPKIIKNLQGSQVGSTLYPVVVKSNAVARTEWDGTGTQAAGLYYVMDYNLGEVSFVNEAGAASPPTNTHAIVVSYSYTTNVYKFDTDLGSLAVDAKYDDFLYRFGLRKAIIEDQRFFSANFGLMSGTVQTAIEQARQFSANYARNGTDLSATGNLGVIKGVPQYKAFAPGLNMGDQRVILGERAQTRWRMAKPWAMGQLENVKDSNGRNIGKKEAYGDQFIYLHTPTQLKAAYTSIVLYSATARVDR